MNSVKLYTRREAADLLNISIKSIIRLTKSGKLPSIRLGNLARIRHVDLEEFIKTSHPESIRTAEQK
jgi:excisionase family DNA binding protein